MKTFDIAITAEELARRRERMECAESFRQPDRVPVLHYIGMRYLLPKIGVTFKEYFSGPRAQIEAQLKGAKWILENVRSDFHRINLFPDFMFVEDTSGFGGDVVFPDEDGPWVARPHLLQKNDKLDDLRRVDVLNTGLYLKMRDWYLQMKEMAQEYEIRLQDGVRLPAADCVVAAGAGTVGLLCLAADLLGTEDLSTGFYDRPEWVHGMLDIVLEKSMQWMDQEIEISGGHTCWCSELRDHTVFIGDDGLAQMSRQHVEEFAMPRHKRQAAHFRAKGMKIEAHNCGRADHILDYWVNEIGIDRYYGFSYLTDKRKVAEVMGGKVTLIGGISTPLLHEGKPEEVVEYCREAIEVLAPASRGGWIMMDGHNVGPGTPLENLNAMTEAAEKYGRYT